MMSLSSRAQPPRQGDSQEEETWKTQPSRNVPSNHRIQNPTSLRLALNAPHARPSQFPALPRNLELFGRNKVESCKWNGWGFNDTALSLVDKNTIHVTGNRYPISGSYMSHWRDFADSIAGFELSFSSKATRELCDRPSLKKNAPFLEAIRSKAPNVEVSVDVKERTFHSHGHTCHEIFELRYSQIKNLPDCVLYPKCHADVEIIMKCAVEHDVAIIPFGGGTSVTLALQVPSTESRFVASVSMSFMQRILKLDIEALLVSVEAGAIGAVLEAQLQEYGVTIGHEPDSLEFSTVGGWVATRASGMKKNAYGNIEDIIVDAVVVTPKGTVSQRCSAPRVSSGPSLMQMILGSEGLFGIITQVLLKVRLLPEKKVYGCLAFPTFESGVAFCRHVALFKMQPASLRLMDATQTQCGTLFKPTPKGGPSITEALGEGIKKFYVRKVCGWKETDLCACTLLFEGSAQEVAQQQSNILKLAKNYQALPAGSTNGERGYHMTFLIAYLRDFIIDHGWIFESFEASMPWPVVLECCYKVKAKITEGCKRHDVKYPPLIMVRLTQVYDGGAVLYFYFGFRYDNLQHPSEIYGEIEDSARRTILDCGGSISHHHGVGKLRKDFYPRAVGHVGKQIMADLKGIFDPKNTLACGNLI